MWYENQNNKSGAWQMVLWFMFLGLAIGVTCFAIGHQAGFKRAQEQQKQEEPPVQNVEVLWLESHKAERLVIKIEPRDPKAMKALQEHIKKFPAKKVSGERQN